MSIPARQGAAHILPVDVRPGPVLRSWSLKRFFYAKKNREAIFFGVDRAPGPVLTYHRPVQTYLRSTKGFLRQKKSRSDFFGVDRAPGPVLTYHRSTCGPGPSRRTSGRRAAELAGTANSELAGIANIEVAGITNAELAGMTNVEPTSIANDHQL